jgi:hypothetical protein
VTEPHNQCQPVIAGDVLLDLAERCGTGPSRALDALIEVEVRRWQAYAIGLNDEQRAHWKPVGTKGEVEEGGTRYHPPTYTFTIDAAMMLVPEGCAVRKEWLPAGSWPARCFIHKDQSMPIHNEDFSFRAIGKTEALAVCAAALRARGKSS